MSGIIAVYGLVVSVLIAGDREYCPPPVASSQAHDCTPVDPSRPYAAASGFVHLGAGLACGLTGLSAGYAIGCVGDSVRLHLSWHVSTCLPEFKIVCSGVRIRGQGIRHHGPHPHLRGGPRSLRVRFSVSVRLSLTYVIEQSHRCTHHELHCAGDVQGLHKLSGSLNVYSPRTTHHNAHVSYMNIWWRIEKHKLSNGVGLHGTYMVFIVAVGCHPSDLGLPLGQETPTEISDH
jgi:hypothetical protein